jgi:hypothetical protein
VNNDAWVEPTICPSCGEPYVMDLPLVGTVRESTVFGSFTVPEGTRIYAGPTHYPCPGKRS